MNSNFAYVLVSKDDDIGEYDDESSEDNDDNDDGDDNDDNDGGIDPRSSGTHEAAGLGKESSDKHQHWINLLSSLSS